tara:strand:+ start:118 stop:708 length:591 start_codon:yes stop_codon:yes gene_type:complete
MKLALFDFDGTISNDDSFRGFIIYYCGYGKFILGSLLLSPIYLLYNLGIIKNNFMKESAISFYFRNENIADLWNKGKQYGNNIIDRMIRDKAKEKIKWHQSKGDKIIVVSASANIWLESWCKKNNIELIATELETIDGRVTGKLINGNCFGNEKVVRVKKLVNINDYEEIYAYGDSRGDRELLDFADKSFYKPFRD